MFQSFGEYLNVKGKVQEKPILDADADTGPGSPKGPKIPASTKPPKAAKSGKGWTAEAAQVKDNNNPKPYKGVGTDPGQQTYEKGLVSKGDDALVYKPKVMKDQNLKTSISKTESFLDQTRSMSSEEYTKFMQKQNGPSFKKILEVAGILKDNNNLMEALVREIKRKGEFSKLVEAVLDHPETYSEIAVNLANEEKSKMIARQFAKSLNEITAPPEVDDDTDIDDSKMPSDKDSIDANGKPVPPEDNVRKTKNVKDIPNSDPNIKMSRKQYVMMHPEHHLIEALASYRNLRAAMIKTLS